MNKWEQFSPMGHQPCILQVFCGDTELCDSLEMWHWFWFTILLRRGSPGVLTWFFLSWWPLIHRSGRIHWRFCLSLSVHIPTVHSGPGETTTGWIWIYWAHCEMVWAQTPFISWPPLISFQPIQPISSAPVISPEKSAISLFPVHTHSLNDHNSLGEKSWGNINL